MRQKHNFQNPLFFPHIIHSQRSNVLKWRGICTHSNLNTAAGAFTAPCGRGDGIFFARTFSNARRSAHHRHFWRPNVLKCPFFCTPSNLNTAAGAFTVPYGRGDGILLARTFSKPRRSAHHRHSHKPNVCNR